MGMGMERNAWFSQATPTQHLAIYPKVMEFLLEKTGIKVDAMLMKKFIPLSGMLNIDEVDDIEKAWQEVANILGMAVKDLKLKILPQAALYSIADHTRTLLFTLSDGALPSNVGGGYNLRILARRALSFIDKYGWDIKLGEVCRKHAEELKPIFPELSRHLDNVERILNHEKEKYEATKENIKREVSRIIARGVITEEDFLELYDSKGITPQLIVEEAVSQGLEWEVPPNFYGKVSEMHEQKKQEHQTNKERQLNISNIPETKALYYDDYKLISFDARVLQVITDEGNYIILDKTAFYPTSGGQLHDIGTINNIQVTDVFKQGPYIIHKVESLNGIKENINVKGEINLKRRVQLTQHHTATHVVNAAAREILGSHINQAGAKKTIKKAHLDITHYKTLTTEEIEAIEKKANEFVKKALDVKKYFLPRSEAEKRFGMSIYQGGAVPGKNIRIVEIVGIDVEACGGTHLDNTSEIEEVKIIKSTKIQDGIVRLIFTAGEAARSVEQNEEELLSKASELLGVEKPYIVSSADKLFRVWKAVRKARAKSINLSEEELNIKGNEPFEGDALKELASKLKTQPQYVIKTIEKFLRDIKDYKNR
jgi:alanyl-tRNA synthetase